jgi:SAM-dependent methyltransferase
MTDQPYQLFPALEPATEAALRASIKRWGVAYPVLVDRRGNIIDGHHRKRICDELGIDCPVRVVEHVGDGEMADYATSVNEDRRHSVERRREMAAALRAEGHSLRAIGGALGVHHETISRDLATVADATVPDRIVGRDGKSRPATRATERDQAVELVTDWLLSEGPDAELVPLNSMSPDDQWYEEARIDRLGAEAEAIVDQVGTDEQALNAAVDELLESKRLPVAKPDLGGGVSHPARYSDELLPVFADLLHDHRSVLDPFGGTGKIHALGQHGHDTTAVEIEPEWAGLHPRTLCASALHLPWDDATFDAICTSPTYGNRLADHHNAADPHLRRSYTHDLGRPLHDDNSGAMQWGDQYRDFHRRAWAEAVRVLKPGGRFVLNIKDHIRGGAWQDVAGWHVAELCRLELTVAAVRPVVTGHLRQGVNGELRVPAELVVAFDKRDPDA